MVASLQDVLNVGGYVLMRLFNRGDEEARRFAAQNAEVMRRRLKLLMTGRWMNIFFTLVTAVGPAAVYWYGGLLIIEGRLSIGDVVAFVAYLTALYGPVTHLAGISISVQETMGVFGRIVGLLERAPGSAATCRGGGARHRPRTNRFRPGDVCLQPRPPAGAGPRQLSARSRDSSSPWSAPAAPARRRRLTWSHASTIRSRAQYASTAWTSARSRSARCSPRSPWSRKTRTCSTTRFAPTCCTPGPTRRPPSSRQPAGGVSTTLLPACPTVMTPWSASAASSYRADSGSASRPGHPQGPAHPHPGRGHRALDSTSERLIQQALAVHARPDHPGHRPPAVHDPGRRPDSGP